MKLANGLMWIGRALGIIQVLLIVWFIVITPPSEWWIYIFAGSLLLIAIYSLFLVVSWRSELLGGILYLVFVDILALLVLFITDPEWSWGYIRLLLPGFVTGVLLLTSGMLKRTRAKTG